ncbi:MAG: WbqC family protein [Bacteroides cellulosilyticus]|nr:WbqC family protein [Bacteroides cellulosilyticus]
MGSVVILPAAYLPSVAYFARLAQGSCVIDLGEHFVKRSQRNRARILTAGGVMELTAHVAHADRLRQPMREVRLDYSKRWQHQHWGALVAGYKGSPYFDHYADMLAPFYERRFEFLADYDLQLLGKLCAWAGVEMPAVSETYVEAGPDDLDLRPKHAEGPAIVAEPYVQVFADRRPFTANLSFVDLLFAEGPACLSVLKRCRLG